MRYFTFQILLISLFFNLIFSSSDSTTSRGYAPGTKIEFYVERLISSVTQVPQDFYKLAYPKPDKIEDYKKENIGELLSGINLKSSIYDLRVLQNTSCEVIPKTSLSLVEASRFIEFIRDDYWVHAIVDGLPVVSPLISKDGESTFYAIGFPVGYREGSSIILNNHLDISILYNQEVENTEFSIVGVIVNPRSIKRGCSGETLGVDGPRIITRRLRGVDWSYSVTWINSPDIKYSQRWNSYLLKDGAGEVHWLGIVNSVLLAMLLSSIAGAILRRALNKDLSEALQDEEIQIEGAFDWKLLHGDVFRRPENPITLSVMVGSGIQVALMISLLAISGILGFLRMGGGVVGSVLIVLFLFMSILSGYFSAVAYKVLRGRNWKLNSIISAVSYPALIIWAFWVVVIARRSEGGFQHITIPGMLGLGAIWLITSAALSLIGSYFGYQRDREPDPVQTNSDSRPLGTQGSWYTKSFGSSLVSGLLPFLAIFIEVVFVWNSMWKSQIYTLYGVLGFSLIVLIYVSSEVSLIMTYLQLCSGNWRWWWRSFINGGSVAFYLLAFAAYWGYRVGVEGSGLIIYGVWTLVIAFSLFFLSGTVGFVSSYLFVRRIYSKIKID